MISNQDKSFWHRYITLVGMNFAQPATICCMKERRDFSDR